MKNICYDKKVVFKKPKNKESSLLKYKASVLIKKGFSTLWQKFDSTYLPISGDLFERLNIYATNNHSGIPLIYYQWSDMYSIKISLFHPLTLRYNLCN